MVRKVHLDEQSMAEALFLDSENRKAVIAMVEKGELSACIAGFISYFDDDIVEKCSKCGAEVSLRPWCKQIIEKKKLPVICLNCVTEKDKGFIITRWLDKLMAKRIKR